LTGSGRRGFAPALLTLPGMLWLSVFFVVPVVTMFGLAFQEGTLETGYRFTGTLANFTGAFEQSDVIVRSILYGVVVTLATLAVSYPMVYWIAFRGGRRKNVYLLLILLPYFIPFLIRTLSWSQIFADQGYVVGFLEALGLTQLFEAVGITNRSDGVMSTHLSVVAGMFYNFLPFMALPLYVALERLDPSMLDAARDLYSSRAQAFWKVTFPLSLPGVFAGSLLTFIPSVGDFIDSELLGGPETFMIGQAIERSFTDSPNYPLGSAMAFLLMAGILVGVFLYARALGTEELTG
jgi:spermidine/putrescine transport system permease protein